VTFLTYTRRRGAYIRPQLPVWKLPRPANSEFRRLRQAKKESAMSQTIAMTTIASRHERYDEQTTGAAVAGGPARKVDYWMIAVCVAFLAFAFLDFFVAAQIIVF
jgi:hypothetical protein